MIHEFEGATEEEAIAKAVEALGINKDEFDVEVLESSKKGFFKKGNVKIRIQVEEDEESEDDLPPFAADPVLEGKVMEFIEILLEKMGYRGSVSLAERESNKLVLEIKSPDANILIGKHGKNLDALQLLANVYVGKLQGKEEHHMKVVLDLENYRNRREDTLVRMAIKAAQIVKKTRRSQLLEPMNPFERRLVHTALGTMRDISTESEGDGLIKQIRVSYVGSDRQE